MDFHHRDQNTSEILYLTVKEGTADGWTVNLDQGGQRLANNIKFRDPLNRDQRETVRWYLEDFLALSPFLIDKAVAAEELLLEYPRKLLKSLGLDTIILSRLRWNKLGTDSQVLQLVICQDIEKCYGDSIHRLFWETLESPSLWNSRLQVVVQRSLADTVQQSPSQEEREDIEDHDVSLPTIEPIGKFKSTKPFNVLLVVARDLRRNQPSMRQDVAPGLALEVLLGIKRLQQEQQHKAYMRLNVEVVRPGTLAAFEHHLQQREEEHGPNYFDAVHFDMHGKIGTRKGKGTKTAILYFSSSRLIPIATGQRDEKDTEAIPALMVARIVKRYQIPLVILNACHSAAADSGANANMAHHFLKRGVQNVKSAEQH
ncbi:hypothetical protein K4F52_002479 [Lecanicillium sp. MT-2017a]|nr:hypothetical protein K4F52_002479 [Lecanicillium sp. MT-2017a]